MLVKTFFMSSLYLYSLAVPLMAFAAAPRALTPGEFLHKGAGVLVGEVVDVQVVEQGEQFESGQVVLEVVELLTGEVDTRLLTIPYRRQLGPVIVNGRGWDLVAPERGKKLILYFQKEIGEYYAAPAGKNAIEEIDAFNSPKVEALRKIVRSQQGPR